MLGGVFCCAVDEDEVMLFADGLFKFSASPRLLAKLSCSLAPRLSSWPRKKAGVMRVVAWKGGKTTIVKRKDRSNAGVLEVSVAVEPFLRRRQYCTYSTVRLLVLVLYKGQLCTVPVLLEQFRLCTLAPRTAYDNGIVVASCAKKKKALQ